MKRYLMLASVVAVAGALQAGNGTFPAPTPSYTYQDGNRQAYDGNRCGNAQNSGQYPSGQYPQDTNTPGGYSLPKPDKMDQNYRDNRWKTDADRALYGQVMGALDDARFSDVRAMVSNGTITLRGTVRTQQDRDDIDRITNRIGAGGNVINQVTVQP